MPFTNPDTNEETRYRDLKLAPQKKFVIKILCDKFGLSQDNSKLIYEFYTYLIRRNVGDNKIADIPGIGKLKKKYSSYKRGYFVYLVAKLEIKKIINRLLDNDIARYKYYNRSKGDLQLVATVLGVEKVIVRDMFITIAWAIVECLLRDYYFKFTRFGILYIRQVKYVNSGGITKGIGNKYYKIARTRRVYFKQINNITRKLETARLSRIMKMVKKND